MKGLEFPVHYSQNACDIIAAHYFRKAVCPTKQAMNAACGRLSTAWLNSGPLRFWMKACLMTKSKTDTL